jgi:hypothetical protein
MLPPPLRQRKPGGVKRRQNSEKAKEDFFAERGNGVRRKIVATVA